MPQDVIENMRARVAHCRRLATMSHNPEIVRVLTDMADQGEVDIRKLEEQARRDQD